MVDNRELKSLLALLTVQPLLADRGYSFVLEWPVELAVLRGTHVHGIWRCEHGLFAWTPPGYTEPTHTVLTAEAALRYTLVALATSY